MTLLEAIQQLGVLLVGAALAMAGSYFATLQAHSLHRERDRENRHYEGLALLREMLAAIRTLHQARESQHMARGQQGPYEDAIYAKLFRARAFIQLEEMTALHEKVNQFVDERSAGMQRSLYADIVKDFNQVQDKIWTEE